MGSESYTRKLCSLHVDIWQTISFVMEKMISCNDSETGIYLYWNVWQFVNMAYHDDVIKWEHFPRYWPLVQGIHWSPVNSAHKGQWRVGLMFSLICAWINDWVNNRMAGDLRRHRTHYDVIAMGSWAAVGSSQWQWTNLNSLRPSDAYMRRQSNQHWFR